jgi:2-succinyl-6-hydroxy-2,4-cyclohexadiene-1-carboxylate synthase
VKPGTLNINLVTLEGFLSPLSELEKHLSFLDSISGHRMPIAICDEIQYQNFCQLGDGSYLDGVIAKIETLPKKNRIAIGYSMGGRILLQILDKAPDLFEKVVFISTHPGLLTDQEKLDRMKSDEVWAKKLETLPLDQFFKEWNAQPVLASSHLRKPSLVVTSSSQHLSKVIREFSLGRQKNMRPLIQSFCYPQLWIAGERDTKFITLHQELRGSKLCRIVVKEAGHRVHFDQSLELSRLILSFFNNFE